MSRTPSPRNAVTSAASTPYCMKTASIPTSARNCSATPLNLDLLNELEDGTIVESDQKNTQQHYILHLCESLPPRQTTPPEPSTVTRDDGSPLYNSASRRWDPSMLPHVLRDNSTSGPFPNPARTNNAARNQTRGSSTPPANERGRRTTITRTYEGINGLLTETQQGTYLPKAGSEEAQVASWLNQITTFIRTHHGQLTPEDDAGPASRTRGRLQRMARRWTAEASTKAQRVADTDLHLKPDIALLRPDEFNQSDSGFSWQNVISFLELTSSEFTPRLRLQLSRVAYAVFVAQPGRRFVAGLSIASQTLRLHLFDRAGAVHSRGYNIHHSPEVLVRVLDALTTAPLQSLGFDPTLSFSTTAIQTKHPRAVLHIEVDGKKYIIDKFLFYSQMIRGRATLCFIVIDPANNARYVVKDCWTRSGRKTVEEDMLKRIKSCGLTYGVPILEAAWTVQISGQDDSTCIRRPSYLIEQLENSEDPPPLEIRVHRRLLLASVGEPLTRFSCIQELVSIFIDIVDIHERLVNMCCIIHRDFSLNNILMYVFAGAWPSRKLEGEDTRLTEREEIIQRLRFRRGLLIDYDHAKFTDVTTKSVSVEKRTGTIPFMAIDMLAEYAMPEGSVVHQPKHDLESLVYVLVWICVLYGDPRTADRGPRHAMDTSLAPWVIPKTLLEFRTLAVFKRGDLYMRTVLKGFTKYFEPLKPTVEQLFEAITESFSTDKVLSHDKVKKILLDAFFSVKEPSLENTELFRSGTKHKTSEDVVQMTRDLRLSE